MKGAMEAADTVLTVKYRHEQIRNRMSPAEAKERWAPRKSPDWLRQVQYWLASLTSQIGQNCQNYRIAKH